MNNPEFPAILAAAKSMVAGAIMACYLAVLLIAGVFENAGIAFAASGGQSEEELPGQEAIDDGLSGDDWLLKRRARLEGTHMRIAYGPQISWHGDFIETDDETGDRQTIGATTPLSEIWEVALFDHLSFFSLKSADKSAGRESLELRIGSTAARAFRVWFAFGPYFNFGEAEGSGVEGTVGFVKSWPNGGSLSAEAYIWRPWDEGYYTILEDGRKYGAATDFTLPLTKNLYIITRAFFEELELGESAKSGPQYAGDRYVVNASAYYRLLHRDGAYMGQGFRNDDLWSEFLVGSEAGIFMRVDFQRYFKPDGFYAVNPVPEVFAQEIGVSFQYAISPHLGVTGEGFVGRDPDRDLQFGELYGIQGRLIMVANPHLKIWAGASYSKTNTTIASSGGQETNILFGINYAF